MVCCSGLDIHSGCFDNRHLGQVVFNTVSTVLYLPSYCTFMIIYICKCVCKYVHAYSVIFSVGYVLPEIQNMHTYN